MLRFRQENLGPSLRSKGRHSHLFLYLFLSWTFPFSLSPSSLSVSEEPNGFRYGSMQSLWNFICVLQMSRRWEKSNSSVSLWPMEELCNIPSSTVCLQYLFFAGQLHEWCRLILTGCWTPTQLLYNSPFQKGRGRKQARKTPWPVTVMFKVVLTWGKLIKCIVN